MISTILIDRMITLSTAHISRYVASILENMLDCQEGFDGITVCAKDNVGYLIFPTETKQFSIDPEWPKCLRDICRIANDMEATVICLDSDGPEITDLISYQW